MDALSIALNKPTLEGRIYYKTDPQVEKHLIFLQSNLRRNIFYKIFINGVLLEMDSNKLLYDIEIQIPRRVWKIENSVTIPANIEEADISFPNLHKKSESYNLPIQIVTDHTYSRAQVFWGNQRSPSRSISLSNDCYALIYEQRLVGFFVNLVPLKT